MSNFESGKVVKMVQLKNGQEVTLRYAKWSDLDDLTDYINELSQEDTFITFSGETITKKEEARYLASVLQDMEFKNKVKILAYHNNMLAGISDVTRITAAKERKKHVGVLGISVRKQYRGAGLGEQLMRTTIEEAINHIDGLRQIILEVYGPNDIAQSLYKKLGFKEGGRIPGGLKYKDEYTDDITMYYDIKK